MLSVDQAEHSLDVHRAKPPTIALRIVTTAHAKSASVSQHQRQKNIEQVINRMRARVMNGYWVFAPPVGYRYERVEGHGKRLVRDEPNATLIT